MLDSKVADLNNVGTGGQGGAITAALFLRRFVTAKSWLHLDIFAWTPAAKPGRPEGAECQSARALYALLARALLLSKMVALDPRINPFRPEIAAKYLQGQVEAARFVEGARHEVVEPIAGLRRTRVARGAARHPGAAGRARDRLRDHRGRLGLGPARSRRLCRLAVGQRAGAAGRGADAQGLRAAHARFSRPGHQAAAGHSAADGRVAGDRAAGRAFRHHRSRVARAGRASCADQGQAAGFRRRRREVSRRALSVGRQDLARHRLLGPGAGRAASGRASPARATATCRNWRSANCRRSPICGAAI